MPIVAADIKYYESATTAGGINSLGGAITATLASSAVNGLFDVVSGAESAAGDTEYRCIYVKNTHATLTLQNAVLWIDTQTTSTQTDLAVGLDPAGVGDGSTTGVAATVADENTAPAGVTFTAPSSLGTGITIGNIPAGQAQAIWLRRNVNAGAAAFSNDTTSITVQGDTAA